MKKRREKKKPVTFTFEFIPTPHPSGKTPEQVIQDLVEKTIKKALSS